MRRHNYSLLTAHYSLILKRFIALILIFCLACTASLPAFAESKTGAGMAEWALRAYNENWSYVYGGSSVGAVDCSGLIRSYTKTGGGAQAQLDAAPVKGNMSSMPRVHGLGLWCEGHAGIYVGKNSSGTNMAVDARNASVGVVYSTMDSRSWNPWVKWFKIKGVTYPTTGWVNFNGGKYYYLNGEFVVGVVTVEGKTYDFGDSGALKGEASPTTMTTTTTTEKTTMTTITTTTTTKTTTTTTKESTATTITTKAPAASKSTSSSQSTGAEQTTTATIKSAKETKNKTLRQGDSGAPVTKLQERLIELGFMTVQATGYYGDQTVKAVKDFQKKANLSSDGVAGGDTQDMIFSSDAPRYEPPAASAATVTTTEKTTGEKASESALPAESTTKTEKKAQEETTAKEKETTTTTAPPPKYRSLDLGSKGDDVKALQMRLAELGYFDQEISGYYGAFTLDAVKYFQKKFMPYPIGVADYDTQERLFADDAPWCTDEIDLSLLYEDESELQVDGGDQDEYDELIASESDLPLSIPDSPGIDGLAARSDVGGFIRKYGGNGSLETLGIYGVAAPTTKIFRNGKSIEITPELERIIDECVFF